MAMHPSNTASVPQAN